MERVPGYSLKVGEVCPEPFLQVGQVDWLWHGSLVPGWRCPALEPNRCVSAGLSIWHQPEKASFVFERPSSTHTFFEMMLGMSCCKNRYRHGHFPRFAASVLGDSGLPGMRPSHCPFAPRRDTAAPANRSLSFSQGQQFMKSQLSGSFP